MFEVEGLGVRRVDVRRPLLMVPAERGEPHVNLLVLARLRRALDVALRDFIEDD